MKPIEGKFYSPFLTETKIPVFEKGFDSEYKIERYWERYGATVHKIRSSSGYPVETFRQLVEEVAMVTLRNRNYEMFYRGQIFDYKDSQATYYKDKTRKTIIYPAISRPEKKADGTYKASIKKCQFQLYQIFLIII